MLVHFNENAVLYSVSKYYIHPKTEAIKVIRFQTEDLIVFVLLIVTFFQKTFGHACSRRLFDRCQQFLFRLDVI